MSKQLYWKIEREAKGFVSDYSLLVSQEQRNMDRVDYLQKKQSYCDRKIVDLRHDIEFTGDATMEEKVKFFDDMKGVTEVRRHVKDRLDFYKQVALFYARGAGNEDFELLGNKISGMIQSKNDRKYKRRVSESEEIK